MDRCKMDGNGDAAKTTMTNVAGQASHAHSSIEESSSPLVAATFGFMPGLLFGLKRG
jgi:hypothetical protein